jgi:hypothetical protein
MINFLTTRRHGYTLRQYLESFGQAIRDRFRQVSYGELFRSRSLPDDAYVFADLERLCPRNRGLAAHIRNRLAASGTGPLLNDPARTLRRYDLLCALHERGLNDFRGYRWGEDLTRVRLPAFLRGEDDHHGGLTPPIGDADALAAALRESRRSWRRRRANFVTEFLDTVDAEGVYRKYSAFFVAGRVIPRHVFFAREWMIKKPVIIDPRFITEERRYVEDNPHRDRLAELFAIAGVGYGRIDYGLWQGRIQTWEINTNPMILIAEDRNCAPRMPVHELFAKRLAEAFEALDREAATGNKTIPIDPPARGSIPAWGSLRERMWHALYV